MHRNTSFVRHFRPIGCKAFVVYKKPNKSKRELGNNEYTLHSHWDESKAYTLWKAGTKIVIKSIKRDVRFIEHESYANTNSEEHSQFYGLEIKPVYNEVWWTQKYW